MPVVRDLRRLVHGASDAVPDEVANDRVAPALRESLDRSAHVTQTLAGPAFGDCGMERFTRSGDEIARRGAHHADCDRARRVAAVTILKTRKVDPDDVTFGENHLVTRDAMHHDPIHRGAQHGGERRSPALPITEERGSGLRAPELALSDPVQLRGRRAGNTRYFDRVQNTGNDDACFAHLEELERVLDDDTHDPCSSIDGGASRRQGFAKSDGLSYDACMVRSLKAMLARVGEEKARARRARIGPPSDEHILERVQECLDLYEELVPLQLAQLAAELGSDDAARAKWRHDAQQRAKAEEQSLLRIQRRLYGNGGE